MTAIIIRRIETRLETMVKPRAGGVTVDQALRAAETNLAGIESICRDELDRRLKPILAFIGRNPDRRPDDDDLRELIAHAEAALTACGALNQPLLGRTLVMLCAMADALSHTQYWPRGALNPAINLISLFQSGHLPDAEGEALMQELHRCLAQYVRHIGDAA